MGDKNLQELFEAEPQPDSSGIPVSRGRRTDSRCFKLQHRVWDVDDSSHFTGVGLNI